MDGDYRLHNVMCPECGLEARGTIEIQHGVQDHRRMDDGSFSWGLFKAFDEATRTEEEGEEVTLICEDRHQWTSAVTYASNGDDGDAILAICNILWQGAPDEVWGCSTVDRIDAVLRKYGYSPPKRTSSGSDVRAMHLNAEETLLAPAGTSTEMVGFTRTPQIGEDGELRDETDEMLRARIRGGLRS